MNILAALTSMRAWSAFSYAMLLLGITGAAGCMSSSTAGDTRRVRDLTRVQEIARVSDVDVDPAAEEDARRILKRPLDADAAVRVALLNNREIRATLREMGIARGRLIQAGVLPNPVVEAELLPERNSEVELRVEYDITGAVLAPIRARAAEPDVEAARYRAAAAVIGLGYSVRVAFYRLQSAEQRLAIARRMLDAHAAARDAAKAIFDAGNVPELNFAGHDAAYERARITVAQLELEVATERERMQRKLGTQGRDTAWSVQGELPDAPESHHIPKDVETRALRASFELSETRHRLEGLARRSGIARTAGWIPDIAVDVHGLYGNPEEGTAEQDEWRFGGGVSVGVPLFNRGQGTATSLEAEHDALLERYYGSAVDVRSAAREAVNRVSSAHARATQYRDIIVPAQARVTAQTLLQYNAMQLGIFQLLEARREEFDVELAYVETLREYWSASAELDAVLAGTRVMQDDRNEGRGAGMGASAQPNGGH